VLHCNARSLDCRGDAHPPRQCDLIRGILNLLAAQASYPKQQIAREAMMQWRDSMVDRPEEHSAGYLGGWIASGLMVLAAIGVAYHFGL
jgi:hypothetical protein